MTEPERPPQARENSDAREYSDARDMDAFWAAAEVKSEPIRAKWYVPSLLLLVALSVPWYFEAGTIGAIVLGLPVWVWTSLACALGVAALTAFAILTRWKDED